jgi:hypothetical protein
MKTAVEYLVEQLNEIGFHTIVIQSIIDKAKEMEKEQMALCYKVGVIDGNNGEVLNFEQYYNKTFNK